MAQQRTTSLRSIPLDLDVKQEAVINGIEMGVLVDLPLYFQTPVIT